MTRDELLWFMRGRSVTGAALGYLAFLALLFVTWYVSFPTYLAGQNQARFVPAAEALPTLGAGVLFAALTPRVALWHALGGRRVRRLSTAFAAVFLMAIVALPAIAYTLVAALPFSAAPGYAQVTNGAANVTLESVAPFESYALSCFNVAFFAGVACAAQALFGRVVGLLALALTYYGVVLAQSVAAVAPLVPVMSVDNEFTWVNGAVGCLGAAAGLLTWHVTGASRPLQRRFRLPH